MTNAHSAAKPATLLLVVLGWALCLASGTFLVQTTGPVGLALRTISTVIRDPEIQWAVFAGLGIYVVVLNVVRRERRFFRDLCLSGLLFAGIVAYAFNYSSGAASSRPLNLLAGMAAGQAAAAWSNRGSRDADRSAPFLIVVGLLILLFVASLNWEGYATGWFRYHTHLRRSTPWDNPNTFGLLMGLGVVLAVGLLSTYRMRQDPQQRNGVTRWPGWIPLALTTCTAFLAVGCFRSYSRGGWLATFCGLIYLAHQTFKGPEHSKAAQREITPRNWTQSIRRNPVPLALILASALVLAFWQFRQSNWYPARRIFSVANLNDFSWRNRVTAWESALQIMAEHPWFGLGWSRPQVIADDYYRPIAFQESLAIELNDYLALGTILGVPALFCFAGFAWFSLTSGPAQLKADPLRATCRAGAIVLLVGFWFNGGLFKLELAGPFWILLASGETPPDEAKGEERCAS